MVDEMDGLAVVRHDAPFGAFWRLVTIGFGLAAIGYAASFSNVVFGGQSGNPTLSLMTWLAVIAFGVWQVARGLVVPGQRWLVAPGRIEITLRGLFHESVQVVPAGDVAQLGIYEDQNVESGITLWGVTIETIAGRRFHGKGFKSKDEAQQLLVQMKTTLHQ